MYSFLLIKIGVHILYRANVREKLVLFATALAYRGLVGLTGGCSSATGSAGESAGGVTGVTIGSTGGCGASSVLAGGTSGVTGSGGSAFNASSTLLASSAGTSSVAGAAGVSLIGLGLSIGSGLTSLIGLIAGSSLAGAGEEKDSIGSGAGVVSTAGVLGNVDAGAGSLTGGAVGVGSACGTGASAFLPPNNFDHMLCFCSGCEFCVFESIMITRYQIWAKSTSFNLLQNENAAPRR